MENKCVNCGKLEKNHYKGSVDEIGGVWCYKKSKYRPGDNRYFTSYKNALVLEGETNG